MATVTVAMRLPSILQKVVNNLWVLTRFMQQKRLSEIIYRFSITHDHFKRKAIRHRTLIFCG